MRSWIVQFRHQGKSPRLTLGPVGALPFEGPPHAPGAADLARTALNARGVATIQSLPSAAPISQGATLAEVWHAYEKAGWPLLNGIGFKRASSIKADGYRWKNQLAALPTVR